MRILCDVKGDLPQLRQLYDRLRVLLISLGEWISEQAQQLESHPDVDEPIRQLAVADMVELLVKQGDYYRKH